MSRSQTSTRASAKGRLLRWLAAFFAIGLVAAACTSSAVDNADAGGDSSSSDSRDSGDSGGSDDGGSDDDGDTVELAQGDEVIEFQVQTGVPASSVYHAEIVEWGERLERMSGGRLQPEVVPSGAVVGALEILDAVDTDIVPVGMAWSNY